MKQAIQRLVCAGSVVAVGAVGIQIEAQRRPPGQAHAKQAVQTSLTVGGQTHESNEPGRCTHAPTASIYQVVSEMWSVQQSSEGRSLTLTLWRPKDGSGDMVSLSVRNGSRSHDINSVRGGSATSGAGKVMLEQSRGGGIFTVEASTKAGTAITGTITCDAFARHTAEGGF